MATFKAVVLAGNSHIKSDGTKNIKIRIYHNKTSQYISTPYYIEETYLKDGVVTAGYRDSDLLNLELGGIIRKYRVVCVKLGTERTSRMSCVEVREQMVAAMEPDYEYIDFVAFAGQVIEKTEKVSTAEWYRIAVVSLCWFFDRKKIDVRDLTVQRLNEYKERLARAGQSGRPLSPGAISNYLRAIRSLLNKAKQHYCPISTGTIVIRTTLCER